MPTLGEAAKILHIGRVTLEKWMRRLDITPERHPYDFRYFTLTPEQIAAIRDARAQMPGVAQQANRPPARLTAKSGRSIPSADTFPIPPADRPLDVALSASFSLPEGMMSKKEAADRHGLPPETVRGWCRAGKVETDPGTYRLPHGRWPVVAPITRKGLAQLLELASPRSDFVPCAECPHVEQREE